LGRIAEISRCFLIVNRNCRWRHANRILYIQQQNSFQYPRKLLGLFCIFPPSIKTLPTPSSSKSIPLLQTPHITMPNHQHQPTNQHHSLTQTLNTPPSPQPQPNPSLPPSLPPTTSSAGGISSITPEIICKPTHPPTHLLILWGDHLRVQATLHSGSGFPFPLPVTRYLDKVHSSPRVNFLGANTLSWCSASSLFD